MNGSDRARRGRDLGKSTTGLIGLGMVLLLTACGGGPAVPTSAAGAATPAATAAPTAAIAPTPAAAAAASPSAAALQATPAPTAVAAVPTPGAAAPGTASPGPKANLVAMMDPAKFEPADLTVPRGATVVWRNTGQTPHTATGDPAKAAKKENVQLPSGAQTWDSGLINAGQEYSRVFDTPGTYKYVCTLHESLGMVGTITVQP